MEPMGTTPPAHEFESMTSNGTSKGDPMQRETKTRVGIAALIYTMTNAVLFGAGLLQCSCYRALA
jgi:hypothetical protein